MALIKSNQIETGVKPNQIVALDKQGKLPAVDGSRLTNLPMTRDVDSYKKELFKQLSQDIDSHKEEIIKHLSQSEEEMKERVLAEVEESVAQTLAPEEIEPEVVDVEIELTLEEVIEEALYTINALAESARQLYLGVGPAQMMVYTEKFEEARDYLVNDMPHDMSSYPFIKAEVGATGRSAGDIANSIIDKKGEWIAFNAKVERIRMITKTQLSKVQTIEYADKVIELASEQLDKLID